MAVTRQQVAELYVATFNRAPDAAGLDYWVNTSGLTIEEIAQSFFDQPETTTKYPLGTTDAAFVEAIYLNLFNRAPDADGLAYWVAKLTATETVPAEMTRDVMIEAMKNGAIALGGTDATIIANKATVGLYVADTLGLNLTDFSLSSVTEDTATVDAAKADADDFAPQALALTTATDAIVGGSGNDTISAVLSGLSSTNTLNGADDVDGGAGTDTLAVTMSANFSGMTASTGSVTNVEVLDITNTSALTRSFDTTGISGLTTVKVDTNDQTFTVSDLESTNLRVELENADETKTVTLTYATINSESVNVGTADSLTLALTDVGSAQVLSATGAVTTAQKQIDVVAAGIEDLTIESNGTSNFVDASVGTSKTLTVTGAAALKVTAVDATVTQVDGSAATGALTLDLTAGTLTSVKTGSGADTVTVDALNVEAVLAGGTGADTLVLKNLAAGTYQPSMTGFETIKLQTQAAAVTLAGGASSDLAAITVLDGLAAAATMTFAEFNSSAIAINFTDTKDLADVNNGGTINYTSAADVTINATTNNTEDTITIYNDAVTASSATSIALNVADDVEFNGAVTAAAATAATITVDKGGELSTGAVTVANAATVDVTANGIVSSAIVAAKATSINVNAGAYSAFSSKITAVLATDVNVVSTDTDAISFDIITDKATTVSINTKSATTFAATADFSTVQNLTLASTAAVDATVAGFNIGDKAASVTVDAAGVKGALDLTLAAYATGSGSTTITGSTLAANTIVISGGRNEITVTGGIGADSVTLDQVFTSTDEVSLSFDLGTVSTTDSVSFASGADITNGTTTFAGVDTVVALGTLAANAASFSGQTIAITAGGLITLGGTASADTINMAGINTSATGYTLDAGAGNDTITGATALTGASVQTINGDAGNDTITAGAFAAVMNGGADNDTIVGAAGIDTITGGTGVDTLTGGAAADTFFFADSGDTGITVATADTIKDFVSGTDKIDFDSLVAGGGAGIYDEAGAAVADFAAALAAANTALDGIIVYQFQYDTTNGYLFIDSDGDNAADQVVILTGIDASEIAAADIIA